jgi:endonuclease/exonuclease/phosphatase family metal-dependent hydrolase
MNEYFIAWWNLENLFNVEDWPDRPQRLKDILKHELKGWNEEILSGKISQLSKIIIKMNNGLGPDLLGVCEVEDGPIVGKLVDSLKSHLNREYQIVHEQVDDKRGIEVAFIYDSTKFEIAKSNNTGEDEVFSHHVLRSEATRNILQVNFKLKSSGSYLVLIGNHWPSRTRGELESEAFRIVAGEALGYFHKRILEELGKDTAILAMGDFNDQPFNRSVMDQGLGTPYDTQVDQAHAESPFFYNLMWRLMADGLATFYYTPKIPFGGGGNNNGGQTTFPNMLDQFMVSSAVKFGSQINIKQDSVNILKDDMHDDTPFQRPVKYGRPSTRDGVNKNGFSDHFPISLVLQEK